MKAKVFFLKNYLNKYVGIGLLSTLIFQQSINAKTVNDQQAAPVESSSVSSNISTDGFVAGTKVLTINKQTGKEELKNIESIQLGDTVVTSTIPSQD